MKQALTLGLVIIALTAFNPFLYAQTAPKKTTGYVSIEEVLQLMPEYKKITNDLKKFDDSLQNQYLEFVSEYRRQDSVLRSLDTSSSNAGKRAAKASILENLAGQIQEFQQDFQSKRQQKEQSLLEPVIQKATQHIETVAKANGFIYVFSKEALIVKPIEDDLLPLIKTKLEGSAPKPKGS
jgi:outer membrane protein